MNKRATAVVVAATVGALLAGGPHTHAAPKNNKKRAARAVRFLVIEQRKDGAIVAFSEIGSTADAVVAFAAAGRGRKPANKALRFLKNSSADVDNIGEIAKVYMALVAAGKNPILAGRDLRQELLDSQTPEGSYGDNSNNDQVSSHALAVLALESDGTGADAEAAQFLVEAQCGNGGWQFDLPATEADDADCYSGENDFTTADSNTTALAIQALAATGSDLDTATDPFGFLDEVKDPAGGGWGYTTMFSTTDANSTALVIQAHLASGRPVPQGAMRALKRLQYGKCSSGASAFAYSYFDADEDGELERSERTGPDVGATSAAIPALMKKPLPVAASSLAKPVPPACR